MSKSWGARMRGRPIPVLALGLREQTPEEIPLLDERLDFVRVQVVGSHHAHVEMEQ